MYFHYEYFLFFLSRVTLLSSCVCVSSWYTWEVYGKRFEKQFQGMMLNIIVAVYSGLYVTSCLNL